MPAESTKTEMTDMVAKPEDLVPKAEKCGTLKSVYIATAVVGTIILLFGAAKAQRLSVLMGVLILIFSIIEYEFAIRISKTCKINLKFKK